MPLNQLGQADLTRENAHCVRLAHISDVHLSISPRLTPKQFASKRALGYLNWHRNRRGAMTTGYLDRLVRDMAMHHPDHIVVTGDLTNIALLSEFKNARNWLEALGPPERVTVIPGNHDAYVRGASQHYLDLWSPWMSPLTSNTGQPALFPFLKEVCGLAIIGVSSATPSPPFFATGRVGHSQALELGELLSRARKAGLFRVILIHHPPSSEFGQHTWRRLTDAALFRQIVKSEGAELVLHGHEHKRSATLIEGPTGLVPVIGVPPGGSGHDQGHRTGGYALHEINIGNDRSHLTTIHRGYRPDQTIGEAGRFESSIK